MTQTDLRRTLAQGARSLAELASPRVDAEILLAHVLDIPRAKLQLLDTLTDDQVTCFEGLITQRAQRIPLQHLTGTAPFRHLTVQVGPGVFIPRPETELIIDLAVAELTDAKVVVDLCSGSGAIALAVAQEFPGADVHAVEKSAAALMWLQRNRDSLTCGGQFSVVAGDVCDDNLLADLTGTVDVVLANPPYVPTLGRENLPAEIAHDPQVAVFAGGDGLALMPAVIATAARLLRPGGRLIVEHAEDQDLQPFLLGWGGFKVLDDLTGRPRFSSAIRCTVAGSD